MKKFVILPDVACDLSGELREYFDLENYIHGYVHINGEAVRSTLDWDTMSRNDFYSTLANKKNTISSAAASPEEFYLLFKEYAQKGYDILSMSLCSKISGTYNISMLAANRIKEDFPECNIYCFDSQRMSGSFGLLVCYALEFQRQGKSFDEIVAWLEENKHKVHQMGPIDDLTFIARRGKISNGKAFFGNLAGVKPMGDCNTEGYVTVLTKVKGIKKALAVTVEYIKELAENIEDQYILIMHSDRQAYAEVLKGMIEAEIKCKKVFVSDVFLTCGTNIGPGMVSVYFLGSPVSENCEREKEAMTAVLARCE
ncbi:MAG: DegV family protein [Clostridiales bacterium]|nr:DegV family protein [Clostridiales bacterium]